MSYNWAGKLTTRGRDLAFRGITFVPPDGASHLLVDLVLNILETNKVLFPLLAGQLPAF